MTVDREFARVVKACADPRRPHGWINRRIISAYTQLFEAGFAHSVETWDGDDLVGGLYGVNIGGLFAGESMFHRKTDASKVALVHLVDRLSSGAGIDQSGALLDVQWVTPHLESLGVNGVPRATYGELLARALEHPTIDWDQERH